MHIFIMMVLLACAANPAVMSRTLFSDSSIDEIHHQWMIKYGRMYANTSEMEKRRAIFKENLFIEERNTINRAAGKNYTLGLNDFSDLTIKELTSSCCGIMNIPSELASSKTAFFNMSVDDIPESVDWRNHGAVTSVKKQGTCGSKGCSYGYLNSAFKFATTPSNGFDGYQLITPGDEQQLLQVVAQQPVAVTIVVGPEFYAFMGDGIYSGPCGPTVNHAVTIVGYGTSVNGQKYWIIKNSWGVNWGDLGYMKLLRGTESPKGLCDITASYSYYSTLTNPSI
ncbi:hypothetical protein TSUD_02650 [Trifolium subterraneum]|uniref:Cathepsin propeptide inhibitor domain-containing protein n=1 Tax=Trifolium subterraneum TaxID=3900 RepID=A0A2Z6M9Y3_TRISU|nr:hypothetical protein TSUD_02650 [Trifolium subterraneum]